MRRTSHKKSRLGCRVCKERKVKCDETRPACRKCALRGRECSYALLPPDLPTPASSVNADDNIGLSADHNGTSGSVEFGTAEWSSVLPDSTHTAAKFSLFHLQLLEHMRTEMTAAIREVQPGLHRWLCLGYKEALRNQFLMYQLLALAAAHKSTTVQGDNSLERFYRTESTKLQTCALSLVDFNGLNVTEKNSLALFTYSTFLGQHVLFDTFNHHDAFSTTLEKLSRCFDLHQGIRAVASQCWNRVHQAWGDEALNQKFLTVNPQIHTTGEECCGLLSRLKSSDLEQNTIDIYCDAVNILQYLFDSLQASPQDRKVLAVQEWLVRVPHSYTTQIRQRRPEALIILSYYGVLLHKAREFWVIGDSGSFLIRSIADHLGEYWTGWMAWPQAAVISRGS